MPGVVGQYVDTTSEVERYAQEYGQHWDVRGDLLQNIQDVRRAFPEETYTQAIHHGVELTKHKISESAEFQSEARALREGLYIDQFHARYESPGENASEYQQNLHADQSVDFVEKQLRSVDRQFPGATEIEKLQMTESKLGLDHDQSERLMAAYGRDTENAAEREKESPQESIQIQDERENALRGRSFNEGLCATKSRLEEIYFNNKTDNGWDAHLEKSEPWSIAEEREFVSQLSHRENRFIALAQGTPGSRYSLDESYRLGAREAVMEFSHENNHRLSQAEREKESIQMRVG